MQRYFVSKNIINEDKNIAIISDKANIHHIKDVMRMKNGDEIILLTNDGYEYLARINQLNTDVSLEIIEKRINNNELKTTVDIVHGLVRREKREETLRRLVELGCHKYIPVLMERSIVKIEKFKENNERINTIIKECSEQSERGILMEYQNPVNFNDLIKMRDEYDYAFICYEESGRSNDQSLSDYHNLINGKKVLVLVGPEGGISETELTKLKEANFVPIGLGKRILRTETAPLYIMSVLGYLTEIGVNHE